MIQSKYLIRFLLLVIRVNQKIMEIDILHIDSLLTWLLLFIILREFCFKMGFCVAIKDFLILVFLPRRRPIVFHLVTLPHRFLKLPCLLPLGHLRLNRHGPQDKLLVVKMLEFSVATQLIDFLNLTRFFCNFCFL